MKRFLALLCAVLAASLVHAADFDVDGLPDDWEITYGFSTNGLPTTNLTSSALVGWWQMDDASQTNVVDRSANALTGTLNDFSAFPFVSGLYSNALSFTTNSYVSFAATNSVLALSNSFSISVWFWGTSDLDETTLIEWTDANTNTWELSVATNGVSQFRFADAAANVRTIAKTNGWDVHDGDWHHIAGVYQRSNSNATLYVDGFAEASGMVTNWGAGAGSLFGLGIISIPPPNAPFQLDEVRLYNVALTSNDIWQLPNTHYDPDLDGLSNLQEQQQGRNPLVSDLPATPGGLSALPASTSRINLSWTDGASNETGQVVERSTNAVEFPWVTALSSNVAAHSVTGLAAGTTYFFRVKATNEVGASGYSATVGASTLAMPSLASNLVALWRMNEGSGTNAFDGSGQGHHAALFNGPSWTNGVVGGGLRFDGGNDKGQAADTVALRLTNTSFTIAGWVNPIPGALYYGLVDKQHNDAHQGWGVWLWKQQLTFSYGNDRSTYQALAHNQWTHFAITYEATNQWLGMYLNGYLHATNSVDYIGSGTYPLVLGMHKQTQYPLNGRLDEVGVWTRALTEADVLELYHQEGDPATPHGSVSGTIQYAGTQAGRIWVVAVTNASSWETTFATTLHGTGTYSIAGLPQASSWWIRAFRDANGNQQKDAWDASGSHGSSIFLTGDLSGVNVTLQDAAPDGLFAGNNTAQTGSTNPTVTNPVPRLSAVHHHPSALAGVGYNLQVATDAAFTNLLWDTTTNNVPTRAWTRLRGSTSWEKLHGGVADRAGNVYATGYTRSGLDGEALVQYSDLLLLKYAPDGTHLQTRVWGSTADESGHDVTLAPDGSLYVAGYTGGSLDGQTNPGLDSQLLTKFSPTGTRLWTRIWGASSGSESAWWVEADASTNVYVAGTMTGTFDGQPHAGQGDLSLTKFAADGTRLWTRLWGTNGWDEAGAIAIHSNGDIFVAGYSTGSVDGQPHAGSDDVVLTRFSPDGTKQWTRQWGSSASDLPAGMAFDSQGNLYISGVTRGSFHSQTNNGEQDLFLSKYTIDGSNLWTRIWGSAKTEETASRIAIDAEDRIYLGGFSWGNYDGQTNTVSWTPDLMVNCYRSDGVRLWTRMWGASSTDHGRSVVYDGMGHLYVLGDTDGSVDGQTNNGQVDTLISQFTIRDSYTSFGTNIADNARTPDLTYSGTSLTVGTTNYWRIKLYDANTNVSPWSASGNWFIYDPTADNDFDNDGIPDDEDPDDDNDGLPDDWEIAHGLDPRNPNDAHGASGDPDGDSLTNLQEYNGSSDPQDYYNGTLPALVILGGNYQWAITNTVLEDPLVVEVFDSSSVSLSNAPVTFTTSGGIQVSTNGSGPWYTNLTVRTASPIGVFALAGPAPGSGGATATAYSGGTNTIASFSLTSVSEPPFCIAKAMRAANERYKQATGVYTNWPPRYWGPEGEIPGGTNTPPLPDDDWYCYDLANIDEREVQLIQALAGVMNDNNMLNRYIVEDDIEGKSNIWVHGTSSETNGVFIVTNSMPAVTGVVCTNHMEKFAILAKRIPKLKKLCFQASQVGTNGLASSVQSRMGGLSVPAEFNPPCEDIKSAATNMWEFAPWIDDVPPIYMREYTATNAFGTTCAIVACRGKLYCNLTNRSGTATCYIKVKPQSGNDSNNPPKPADSKFHSYLSVTAGSEWTSTNILANTKPQFTANSTCPNEGRASGWELENQVVLLVPSFSTYDPAQCEECFKVIETKWVGVSIEGANNLQTGNPTTHGGGWKILAEKNSPTGSVHKLVKVEATLNQSVAANGRARVFFKLFDMDDPTQNYANRDDTNLTYNVVDTNDTAAASYGDDNKPSGVGIQALIITNYMGTAYTNSVSPGLVEVFVTNSGNKATLLYEITNRQPGNNWRVATHISKCFINDVTINTVTNSGIDFTRASNTNATISIDYKTTLLSVWRTLHVELDSMTAVTNNIFDTNVTNISGSASFATNLVVDRHFILGVMPFDGSDNLSDCTNCFGRFELGSVKLGADNVETADIDGNGNTFIRKHTGFNIPFSLPAAEATGQVVSMSENAFGIQGTLGGSFPGAAFYVAGTTFTVASNTASLVYVTTSSPQIPCTLLDDDVDSLLPHTLALDLLNNSDLFAKAYIYATSIPGSLNLTNTVSFQANIASLEDGNPTAAPARDVSSQADYWAAHVLAAYQGPVRDDNDPASPADVVPGQPPSENAIHGFSPGSLLMFRETTRDSALQQGDTLVVQEPRVLVHEVGHRFGLYHPDFRPSGAPYPDDDVMTRQFPIPGSKVRFNQFNLRDIREIPYPPNE